MTVFPRSEYALRIERVKQRMAAAGIDVLLCTDPANMNYLSGYDGWSFYVHQLVALALDADGAGLDRPRRWMRRARGSPPSCDRRTSAAIPTTTSIRRERHPMAFVAQELARARLGQGPDRRRDGCLLASPRRPTRSWRRRCRAPSWSMRRRWSTGSGSSSRRPSSR